MFLDSIRDVLLLAQAHLVWVAGARPPPPGDGAVAVDHYADCLGVSAVYGQDGHGGLSSEI